MSNAGDEDDDEERFYESLDRLLSSASSCSSSSAEADDDIDNDLARDHPNCFNSASPSYDVWISEPSSVEERRARLLQRMGLTRDPLLSRHTSSPPSSADRARGEFAKSASADHLNGTQRPPQVSSSTDSSPGMARSKSDGANRPLDPCNSNSTVYPPEIPYTNSIPPPISETGGPFVNNHISSVVNSRSGNGSLVYNATSPNKPPTGKNGRRVEEIKDDASSSSPNGNCNSSPVLGSANAGEVDCTLGCGGIVDVPACTIKNLDNGKEFVVNEVREDGTWNKLKEVGTGKQLTMEEFEMCVGHSPIVQELMRRQNVEDGNKDNVDQNLNGSGGSGSKHKKKGSWLKSIRNVASTMTGYKERRSSDERDTSSEKGGQRSSSATDDSQDVSFHGPERVRVRQYGKSCKEVTALYKSQEIQAHNGSIWTVKFSFDGKYLASAGEDCVIHVWQVVESERKGDMLMDRLEDGNLNFLFVANGSPEPTSISPNLESHSEKKRRGRSSISRKSVSLEQGLVPETVFALSEKPVCSLQGHLDDVLDLSWSKTQHLLSSSMDKTVRLWHLSSKSCLKIFSHSDYVTCIQFNPVDDRYFISGSLDAKVRIWSIPDRQVVDWNDLHEMVTAACYTPDGQGALVGSYKGSCRFYNTSENKLQQKGQINLQNKKKKSHHKKITGFQFAPGSSSEVLITSSDSRIRVVDGVDLVHKFKGFRNTNSQISASLTANGKYVVCASEDSHVYIWKHEGDSRPNRSKGVTVTRSYEHFYCQDVSVAIPWPVTCDSWGFQDSSLGEENQLGDNLDEVLTANHPPPTPVEDMNGCAGSPLASGCFSSPLHGTMSSASNSYIFDRISATWPEEKLHLATKRNSSPRISMDLSNELIQNSSAWGMVIVTASLRGEIKTFQNFGLPVRI
ncbi:uncharacterized protein LOC127792078 [Diospyros lotus]|uniref:uncharacterized protein LOC127792078 n=1 Tax=Diospyros lotus TaxID=55363 RepID=UPI0022506789|nr:uncharacterized protein LOC127792078 [Diospyros lotus]